MFLLLDSGFLDLFVLEVWIWGVCAFWILVILEMGIFEFLSFRIRGVVFWCVLCSDFECLELFDGDCSALLFFSDIGFGA